MAKHTERVSRKRQIKKERIYKAALSVFGKYGYRKATLEDIASELHMTQSGLYRYFRDKRDLYEKAVAYGLVEWQRTSASAIENESDPLSQLQNYALTGANYLNENDDLRNVLINDPSVFPLNTKEDHFAPINRESMNILRDILKQGIKENRIRSVDLDYTTSFLYSVYVMFIIKSYVKPDIGSSDDMLKTSLDILLHGIAK
ncbi:TetR/AcrR family transcriptional regulator [uncultured Desulfosarcina sp.]|uniref:TetR/AcrR family transcriptional regulator n=1 Tax=uncultured Desulfosarcina sp. TaxID=218289 RepID=UPI0029C717DE|nr:TetR/AcrR family transcriptional regulator [uncultured Desulfosarcina sp.]